MLADHGDDRTGENPLVCRFGGVIVIDGSAGRILAVDGVTGRTVSALGDRSVDSAIIEAGERARLIDDAGERIREGGMLHAVENHRADGYLSCVGFASGFGGYNLGQQVNVRAAEAPQAGRARNAQGGKRLGPGNAVLREAVVALEGNDSLARLFAENAVYGAGIVAKLLSGASEFCGPRRPVSPLWRALPRFPDRRRRDWRRRRRYRAESEQRLLRRAVGERCGVSWEQLLCYHIV